MSGSKIIIALALAVLVIALPVYILREPDRMAQAQEELRQEFVSDAAVLYVENCAVCHGAAGEGIGSMPPLDNPSLRTADYDLLFKTIARGRYGTTMAGWHSEEGGAFNSYQIDELVALVRYVDWSQVNELAAEQGLIPPTLPVPEVDEELIQEITALSPEGTAWAEGMRLYANNCTICHGLDGTGSELGVSLNNPDLREKDREDLYRIISEGVPGTMMTSWVNALEPTEIESLVSFLLNWDVIEGKGLVLVPPEPVHVDLDNPEEVLALGERLFSTTCSACHGEKGSGGTGPALNSLQILTNKTDEQIENTIIQGGQRPNSTMPAFGDRMTSVEIGALIEYIRSWESTATWVENPRGTQQGGGPPWLRATPDANNPISPGTSGSGGRGGGPPWRTTETAAATAAASGQTGSAVSEPAFLVMGEVVENVGNTLTILDSEGFQLNAMLGPPWFWSENGIALEPGHQIELEGFQSADHMEVNWLVNKSTGQSIQLRTPEGLPVWNN